MPNYVHLNSTCFRKLFKIVKLCVLMEKTLTIGKLRTQICLIPNKYKCFDKRPVFARLDTCVCLKPCYDEFFLYQGDSKNVQDTVTKTCIG